MYLKEWPTKLKEVNTVEGLPCTTVAEEEPVKGFKYGTVVIYGQLCFKSGICVEES